MLLLFASKSRGFHRDRGWAAWLGKLHQAHVSIWRAQRYDRFRSFVQLRLGFFGPSLTLTLVKYREGGSLPWHFDTAMKHHLGVVIVLKPSERGGEFLWRGQRPHFESDRVIVFDGAKTEHSVSTIEKGTRWIAMIQANR